MKWYHHAGYPKADVSKPRSPFWYACYSTAEGVRRRLSTELTDKRAAEKVALALQRAEDERRKGTISTQRIVDLLNDTLRSAGLEKIETVRVRAWLESWLEAKRNITRRPGSAMRRRRESSWSFSGPATEQLLIVSPSVTSRLSLTI